MKVVHVSTEDINGGAAIAAHRLHLAMLKKGMNSKMLVMSKMSDELNIDAANSGKLEKYFFSSFRKLREKLIFKKYKNKKKSVVFSSGKYGIDISDHPYVKEADLIHLHWISGAYISLDGLRKLGKLNKKIVWTFHDMWAFTGGCHYSNQCDKYEKQCGDCPSLESNKEEDITRKIWLKKYKVFNELDITIITCSKWLRECVKNSSLLKNKKVIVIPNILDSRIFKPIDKNIAKEILNLDKCKKYICFGAINSTSDPRKGYKYLKKSLEKLSKGNLEDKKNIEILVFGSSHSKEIEKLPFKTNFLGRIYDEHTLAIVYNSADIFVGPSLEEAFGQTFNEAIFCGIPAIAFSKTGTEDIIEHKKNGYLAEYKNSNDLAVGIQWTLENLGKVKIEKKGFEKEEVLNRILNIYEA